MKEVIKTLFKWLKYKTEGDDLDDQCLSLNSYVNSNLNPEQKIMRSISLRKHSIDLLNILGFKKVAFNVIKDLIPLCELYGLFDVAIDCCRKAILYKAFSCEEWAPFEERLFHLMKCNELDIKAELMFCRILDQYNNDRSKVMAFKEDLKKFQNKTKNIGLSFKYYYHMYHSKNIIFDSENNLISLIGNSLDAYNYFSELEFDHLSLRVLFLRHAIDAMMQLGQVERAKATLNTFSVKDKVNTPAEVYKYEMEIAIAEGIGDAKKAYKLAQAIPLIAGYKHTTPQIKSRIQKLIKRLKQKVKEEVKEKNKKLN